MFVPAAVERSIRSAVANKPIKGRGKTITDLAFTLLKFIQEAKKWVNAYATVVKTSKAV